MRLPEQNLHILISKIEISYTIESLQACEDSSELEEKETLKVKILKLTRSGIIMAISKYVNFYFQGYRTSSDIWRYLEILALHDNKKSELKRVIQLQGD